MNRIRLISLISSFTLLLAACDAGSPSGISLADERALEEIESQNAAGFEARPAYNPGTLVEYFAQSGDTLQSLEGRFNTSREEIMKANTIIPEDVTSLPAGLPMQIPIYYRAFWGSQYLILPNGHFPNGPYQSNFDTVGFIDSQSGWLKEFSGTAARDVLSAGEMIDLVATNFSISPRLFIALIEERTGALTNAFPGEQDIYPLGYREEFYEGLYLQLVWAANTLNNGYYGWRSGKLIEFDLLDGSIYRPDPWQNAASVAIQYLYAQILPADEYWTAISSSGFAASYSGLFGDAWQEIADYIPGSLQQPELRLPFVSGESWSHTGGPHTGWGEGAPWAALDFAPAATSSGCVQSDVWATAVADGLVVRTGEGIVVLDLDRDGDERTGWVIFYLHLEERGRARLGDILFAGQPLGHPSCEGGSSTGTHIHIARKYNGEWILASGDLPFVMEGWESIEGQMVYEGQLSKPGFIVTACRCSDANSSITSFADAVDFPTPSSFDLPVASPTPIP